MSDPSKSGLRRRLRRIAVDLAPLRESRDFRLLWGGQMVSMLGSSVALVCLPFQVYRLTGSPMAVGLLGATELVPLVVASIVGGAVADAHERRKLLLLILGLQAGSAGVLAWHSAGDEQLWVLYVMSAVQAGLWGMAIPARRSWTPRLFPPERLAAAVALESTSMTATHLLGPAVGGVALATLGIATTYAVDAASFLVVFAAVLAMRPSPPSEHAQRVGLESIREGLRFLRGRPVLQGGFWIDFNAMVFCLPKALFPAMAVALGGGPRTLGLLYAAPWLGAFLSATTSGWVTRVRRQGLGISISVVGWGLAMAAFGLAHSLIVAIIALAAAGFADEVSAILRTAIVQEVTPDHLRGRLSGIEIAIYAGGPTLGDMESGVVAGLTSVRFSIISGGLACLAGAAVVAALLPAFNRYDRSKKIVDTAQPAS
ncbi:MAG: MFS transporter [Actinomycetota bacterium]